MSESIPSSEPTIPVTRKPWDWRLLGFLLGGFSHRLSREPEQPPPYVAWTALGAGALEGLLLGLIQGGIICLIFFVFWGGIVGAAFGGIAWSVRRRAGTVVLSLLAGLVLEGVGGCLIALFVPIFALAPLWGIIGSILLTLLVCIPLVCLLCMAVWREVRAAMTGLLVGSLIGMVVQTAAVVFLAVKELGVWGAIFFGVGAGMIPGLIFGALAGAFLGALVGALVNVNRLTILPTYAGFAAAIGFTLAGWSIGESIAGVDGKVIGGMLGFSWGAVAGVRFGVLLTPRSWRALSFKDKSNPLSPAVFDMTDGRRLAELANTPYRIMLFMMILGQIGFRTRKIGLEPVGEEYHVILECPDRTLEPHPPMPLPIGHEMITALKELAQLEPTDNNSSFQHRDGEVQIILANYRVDLHMVFEPNPRRERATITFRPDAGAEDAAARTCVRFLFLLQARRWFSPRKWLNPRGLWEIA